MPVRVDAGGYAVTKGLVEAAKEGAVVLDKAGHQALERAKEYDQKMAVAATHKIGNSGGGKMGNGKRRASLSVSLIDGAPVAVGIGGGMMAMPEGMELKVIDGVPVAVPSVMSEAPAVGIAVDFEADDV